MVWLAITGGLMAAVGLMSGRAGRDADRAGFEPQRLDDGRPDPAMRRQRDMVTYWRVNMAMGWCGVVVLALGVVGLLVQFVR